ncbi:nitroreductase family protein [Ruminococcus sp.]|uniref:nitroreductase family protein n=1 Tax=Ruminococcus sp. TaxID=41978 RepID=UPI0025D3D589|nr:nitroreductase family protein [Ruminococcus sp.]
MEFQNVIESRRSIRKYSKKASKEQVEAIIAAAIEAPSWKNSQTARYYCVLSDEMCKKVREECLPGFNCERSENAALIVTSFVHNRAGFDREGNPDNEVGNGWGFYDLGLHNEILVLKAAELGLGSLIMGIRDGEKLREVLGIPETETVVSVIAVGYADEAPQRPKRKAVEDITKFF